MCAGNKQSLFQIMACRLAIIWTNAVILLIGPLGTNFSEILIEILTFSSTKMRLKAPSGKWRPFCLGLNEVSLYWHLAPSWLFIARFIARLHQSLRWGSQNLWSFHPFWHYLYRIVSWTVVCVLPSMYVIQSSVMICMVWRHGFIVVSINIYLNWFWLET